MMYEWTTVSTTEPFKPRQIHARHVFDQVWKMPLLILRKWLGPTSLILRVIDAKSQLRAEVLGVTFMPMTKTTLVS